ncbi:MAG: SCO family protein [Planctomycetes bacterium]|nr:SCO family protein [Planctomycetota bacterium]
MMFPALLLAFAGGASIFAADLCCAPDTGEGTPRDFVTTWAEPAERERIPLDFTFVHHDGSVVDAGILRGSPVVLAFAYTRCTNPLKCTATMASMVSLKKAIRDEARLQNARIIVVSYDAYLDDAASVTAYSQVHDLRLDGSAQFLVPIPGSNERLFKEWGVLATATDLGVSLHANQLFILDSHARVARRYSVLRPDESSVLEDLRLLSSESSAEADAPRLALDD